MTDADNMILSSDECKPDCDPNDRVIADQPETFVFSNEWDQLVIRQKNYPDDDMWVRFAPSFLPAIVERMCEWAGEAHTLAVIDRLNAVVGERRDANGNPETKPAPIEGKAAETAGFSQARRAPTAADRQRRYRERKRVNGNEPGRSFEEAAE